MDTLHLVPKPFKIELFSGTFHLTPETVIRVSENARTVGEYLAQRLRPSTGLGLDIQSNDRDDRQQNSIILRLVADKPTLGEEGHELSVRTDQILITAYTPAGLFYGCQTLLQLFPAGIEKNEPVQELSLTVPLVEIEDRPRFSWRGMHLDVGRHFMPKEFIKSYIDLMARYKLNTFHWHLTEDQGWRIEIDAYPKLSEISAWRLENGQRYGGYYTKAEVREIVEYAKERFVTIVPEIEIPGHCVSALAAYPELSCTGGPFEVPTIWGIFDDVYCAGNEQTFEFLEHVLAEVMELFPGKYLHIGGDECPKTRWKECPKCQERIKTEGLHDEDELQSYVIRRIEKFLLAYNRQLIGWDEILEGGLAPNAAVMSWRGTEGGIKAAQLGHDVVMTPQSHCYFDHYQSEDREQEPKAIGGHLPLEKVYSLEPIPAELSPEQAHHILGAQGSLWTEYIPGPEQVEYMLLPRMCALAEAVWSAKELREWDDFLTRFSSHYARFDTLGVNYRHP